MDLKLQVQTWFAEKEFFKSSTLEKVEPGGDS